MLPFKLNKKIKSNEIKFFEDFIFKYAGNNLDNTSIESQIKA